MLRIIIGRAGSGKTGLIMDEIKSKIESGAKELVLIVPEQYSHDAERLLCEKCGDSASLNAQVLSFTRIYSCVASEMGGTADKFLDDAGKILVMSRALELAAPYTKVYGRLSKKSEFISKLVETAKEFRSSGVVLQNIIETSANVRPALKDKLNDLSVILQIYWSLTDHEVRDPDERLDRLAEILPESTFADNGHTWLDGFADFTAQQYSVIKALLKKCESVTVCLTCDDLYSDDIIFENARDTANKLIKLADEMKIPCTVTVQEKCMISRPASIKFLEKNIFSQNPVAFDGVCGEISTWECKNPTEECELAAAKAIELVQNGARWSDIAVAAGGYEGYSALLESVFDKYGVPIYRNKKLDILHMPPVLAVLTALRVISEGWSYEDVFTYLKTGFANITNEECDLLENYVLMWNIRGTLWYREEAWSFSQGGYKSAADDSFLTKINEIRQRVARPLKLLSDSMSAAESNRDRLIAVCDFMENIALYDKLEKCIARCSKSGNREMEDAYSSLGAVITGAIEQFYNVAGEYNSKLDEFIYQLSLLFSQYDIGVIPTSVDCVTVGDITRLRKRNIKYLFIIGMTENAVPAITHSDGVFSDAERDELAAMNLGIAQTTQQRLYGDLSAVYDILTMPEKCIYLMYPVVDTSGSGNKPSYIFENIVRCMGIDVKTPVPSEYKTFAEAPCVEYAAVYKDAVSEAAAAAEYFENSDKFKNLLSAVSKISELKRKHMTPESAKLLYGDKITMTASRVDKYSSCRYAYFLQYGLKAKPRTKAEFDASVIGTFVHYLLENVTRDVEKMGGFAAVDNNECVSLTKKYVSDFVENELQGMRDKTQRFKYLFETLTKDAVSIVLNFAEELRKSDFKPIDFELDFSYNGDLPPYEVSDDESLLAVRGVVDRVDGWVHDGKLYIRVVDYKTGVKSFNLSDIWYGIGIQMLLYLFALRTLGKERYDLEIVPAGVLYAPAREVLLSESRYVTDAELEKNRLKSLKRSGLILNDDEVINAMEHGDKKLYIPVKMAKDGTFSGESLANAEQLGLLAKHIDKTLLDISKEIFSGDVSADPYYRSQVDNSCFYCDYFHACHYNEARDGKYRSLNKLKTPDVWINLAKEAENE